MSRRWNVRIVIILVCFPLGIPVMGCWSGHGCFIYRFVGVGMTSDIITMCFVLVVSVQCVCVSRLPSSVASYYYIPSQFPASSKRICNANKARYFLIERIDSVKIIKISETSKRY